ncbi:MAG: Com family DNA-binding transcriptional regulator [Pseudomonadota bacterium]
MQTIRCGKCNRKLAEAEFKHLAIMCPRCGTLNVVKAASLEPERHRASSRKETTDGNLKP